MTFLESIKTCLDKYATFSGRASRSEYWWFMLFLIIVGFVLDMLFPIDLPVYSVVNSIHFVYTLADGVVGQELMSGEGDNLALRNPVAQWAQLIGNLFLFIPFLSVAVRRLHDVGRSAWWQLISLTGIGVILLIYWSCKKGTPGPNRFGEDPLRGDDHAPITAQISE